MGSIHEPAARESGNPSSSPCCAGGARDGGSGAHVDRGPLCPGRAVAGSWQQRECSEYLWGTDFATDFVGWAVGYEGTILKTTDGGHSWLMQDSDTMTNLCGVSSSSASISSTVGFRGTLLRTIDGGVNWLPQSSGATTNLCEVSSIGDTTSWAVGDAGTILKTADGGSHWANKASDTTRNLHAVGLVNDSTGWASGASGTILKTTDGGEKCVQQDSAVTGVLRGIHLMSETTGWMVGDAGTILQTTDGGASWSSQASGTMQSLRAIGFSDAVSGWAVGDGGIRLAYKTSKPKLCLSGADDAWHASSVTLGVNASVDDALTISALQYSTDGGSTSIDVPGSGPNRELTISADGASELGVRLSDSNGRGDDQVGHGQVGAYWAKEPSLTLKTKYLRVNAWDKVQWKCKLARGHYSMKISACDLIGSTQVKDSTARLVVR